MDSLGLTKNLGPKSLAAFFLVVFSFFTTQANLKGYEDLVKYAKTIAPAMKSAFLHADFFKLYPLIPVMFVWALVGALVYLAYYSLRVAYNDLTALVISGAPANGTRSDISIINVSRIKRILLHAVLVAYYLLAGFITYLVTIPASETIRSYVKSAISGFIPGDSAIYISFIPSFLFCLVMIEVFAVVLGWIFSLLIETEIEEEHTPEEIRS